MSSRPSRIEWPSYGFVFLAVAAAVLLPGGTNWADVQSPAIDPAPPIAASSPAEIRPVAHETLAGDTVQLDAQDGSGPLVCFVAGPAGKSAAQAPPQVQTSQQPPAQQAADEPPAADDESDSQDAPDSAATSAPLTPELIALRDKIRRALAMYFPRHQNARDNNAWEVMHAIIAYGVDTHIYRNGPGGEKVNAIGWLCFNRPCAGETMLYLGGRGQLEARRGPGVQGHYGQFLAILAQSHLKSDYPLLVSGKNFTLEDLIEHEKANCHAGEELTFKLIALMHYLDSDATWKNRDGQDWSIQRLIQEELKQPIRGAACGGTHRLMGFSYAVNKRIQRGQPVVGEFRRAQIFTQDYHRYTFSLQNPDGSFSTEWFVRRGDNPDIDRRLKTSGHILEWISFSVSEDELRDPRMVKAADYVATLLLAHDRHTWEIGPLGHGLHALAIYDRRLFKPFDTDRPQTIVDTSMSEAARQARRADEALSN